MPKSAITMSESSSTVLYKMFSGLVIDGWTSDERTEVYSRCENVLEIPMDDVMIV